MMRELTQTTGATRNQSVSLPRCAPAGLTIVLSAGIIAGPVGTHLAGGPVVSLLNSKPLLPVEFTLERRRRAGTTAATTLSEIRRWTGLAWGAIADILEVSRKAVHNWASGEEPAGPNSDRLAQLHQRAEELHALHGRMLAGTTIAMENGVTVRLSRASPRAEPVGVPPLLYAENVAEAPTLRRAGTRKRVRLREA